MVSPNPVSSATEKVRNVDNQNIYLYNGLEQSQVYTSTISFSSTFISVL